MQRSSSVTDEDQIKYSGGAYGRFSASITHFHEFCKNTSIHGMQYLGETRRPTAERVCWVLILVISVAVCLYSILDKYNKYEHSPVIISFADSMTPIWQIPFPAVTICSYTRSRATVFNYTRALNNWLDLGKVAEEDLAKFEAVSLMCINKNVSGDYTIDKTSTLNTLKEVGVPMSQMFDSVQWRNNFYHASQWFYPVLLSDHGVCYSFNMLNSGEIYTKEAEQDEYFLTNTSRNAQDWSLVEGYTKKAGLDPYPHRGLGTNIRNGLSAVMTSFDADVNYVCHGNYQGFKVFIHNSAEVPTKNSKFIFVPLNQEVTVTVQPDLLTTSDDLRNYETERRQCHYPADRKLRFFNVYTQGNCALECLTNFTLYMCECVAYYMPHDANTSICGPLNKPCMEYSAEQLPKMEVMQLLRELGDSSIEDHSSQLEFDHKACDCLPSCTELQYDTKITQSEFNWKQVLNEYREEHDIKEGLQMGRINIYFDEMQFLSSRRSELYGRTDFLASCGGLLGLFMGFSILSLVEIVYFFTIRACCNLAKPSKKKKKSHITVAAGNDEPKDSKLQLP